VVLAVHVLILRPAPGAVEERDSRSATAFITRTIETAQAAPAPESTPAPAAARLPAAAAPPRPASLSKPLPPELPTPGPAQQSLALLTVAATPPPGPDSATGAVPARTLPPTSPARAIADSTRLRYEVAAQTRGIELRANAELVWRHDGNEYEARLETVLPLVPRRVQQSTGQITPEGLAPSRYAEKGRNEEAAHFERDKGQLSFSNNQPPVPLQSGAQDRLSVLLQLGAIIGGAPERFPPGSAINVQTASTRDADVWQFTVEGEEELVLPGGRTKAIKLVRTPRKPFDQAVELWLAPGMDYVPVRVRLTQPNGDRLDQQWSGTDRA
jgi:hypothetical protein